MTPAGCDAIVSGVRCGWSPTAMLPECNDTTAMVAVSQEGRSICGK